MSKETIAIDIDDVLSSQIDVLIQFSNELYSMNLTHKDFKTPGEYWGYYERVWGVGKDEGRKRFQRFLDERHPLRQVVHPEAAEAIRVLKKTYNLDVVTSRGLDYRGGTVEWLEKHTPGIFRNVHFVDLWHEPNEKATKAKVCQEIGAGYLIDDNADHCNMAAEVGLKTLLFGEWGWSSHQRLHPKVTRVADWQEVLEYFDARSGR